MGNQATIRNGRIKDKNQVLVLWQEMTDYHIEMSSIDFEMNDDAPKLFMKFFENNVRSRNKKAIVAEEDGRIIGYLLGAIQKRPPVFKTTHQAFITDAAVTENKRKSGVGTKMLKVFKAWAKEKGMMYIALSVAFENEIGKKFWNKQGFKTILLSQRKML